MAVNYDIRSFKTKQHLLDLIGIELADFDRILSFDPSDLEKPPKERVVGGLTVSEISLPVFFQHQIPKKNTSRGKRIVWEVSRFYADAYKTLARRLDVFFRTTISGYPHPNVYGYVKGRNIKENADRHKGQRKILKTDISNFFPTINAVRIKMLFSELGVNSEIAKELASFLTIDDKLPLGLSTSPILTNSICFRLDIELSEIAKNCGAIYTRYADDMTFSSEVTVPNVKDIEDIVVRHGFKLSHEKTRKSTIGQAHYVTGLSVSDRKAPHSPRKLKQDLRQELFFAHKFGLDSHFDKLGISSESDKQQSVNRLDGLVRYVSYHEPRKAAVLNRKWAKILGQCGHAKSFEPKNSDHTPMVIYIDETEFKLNGESYLALGLSTSLKQEQIDFATKKILDDYLANPWADGKLQAILKNGMHFSDATEDLRLKYIEAMQKMPFHGFVVYGKIYDTKDYQKIYLKLLQFVIRRRLMAADGHIACLRFEENNKVLIKQIEEIIFSEIKKLHSENNRCPKHFHCESVDKKHLGIAVPDFLLGVFRKYVECSKKHLIQRLESI